MYSSNNIQETGLRSLNSMDRIKTVMKTLYHDILQFEQSGDSSAFENNEEYYDGMLKSMRYGLLDNYIFLIKLEHGENLPAVMKCFIDDIAAIKEIKTKI